jgi:hypothetical protein
MRGALIHGVLLAVMLVYGYRTWTRDKTVQPNVGNVVLWDKSETDLVSIEYRSPKKIVRVEKKPQGYWWGIDTTIETKAKPPKPADAAGSGAGSGSAGSGAGSGSAGSGAGSGSAGSGAGSAAPPEPPTIEEEETGRKVREFPLGEGGEKIVKAFAAARALRDLGKPNDAAKKDYKLNTKPTNVVTMKDGKDVSTYTITVNFKDGSSRTFQLGGAVYGGSDKYALEQQSGKAYVLSRDMLSALEVGQTSLQLTDARGFDATKIGSVTLDANGKSKSFVRITTQGGADGTQQVKTWADPATKKADQTAANFIDNANNLRPVEYASNLKVSDMTPVMKLTYKDERGALLGTLSLYKYEKPGQLAEGQELDPANPPKGDTEYYIMTEKTRVPALVRKDTAQRSENDIETVFSGKQPEPKSAVEPHGNPFGSMPPGHGGMPSANPAPTPPSGANAGSAAMPGAGAGHAAPPAGTGSAAKADAPAATPPAPTGAATPPAAKPAAPTVAPAPAKPAAGAGSAAGKPTPSPTPPAAPAK